MNYDACEHSCILTLLSSLGPLRRMLADTPLPHGSGANLAIVGPLSEGFGRIVASSPCLVGYVRWDARSNQAPPSLDNHSNSFTGRTCPIHKSVSCCGRELLPRPKLIRLGVQRVEDPHHARGYRELRSSAEMRKLMNRKIVEQGGICPICHEEFTDYNDVVPDHREPKGMGGAWRDDHPDNIQATHWWCNADKGSTRVDG